MLTVEQMRERQLVISEEAFSNPLGKISNFAKSKFMDIATSFSDIRHTKKDVNSLYVVKLDESQKKLPVIKKVGFIPLADVKVPVMEGLTGDSFEVAKVLNQSLEIADHILKETLKPLETLMLNFIGDPSRLSKMDANDFKKINLFEVHVDTARSKLKEHISNSHSVQTRQFKELYDNIEGFQNHLNYCRNQLYPSYARAGEKRLEIVSKLQEISKSIDLLMLRIEQKPDTFAISAFNANKLAGVIISVAELVEFLGSMQVMTDEHLATMLSSYNKILDVAKK